MSPPPTEDNRKHCPACGAYVEPAWTKCWLCGTQLGAESGSATSPAPSLQAPSIPAGGYSLASLMLFVTLLAVVLGVCSFAPGIGIPLGIVVLVVWLRTTAVVKYRQAHGRDTSRSEKVQLFAQSFAVVVGLVIVTQVLTILAAVAALFVICSAAAGGGGGGESMGWFVAFALGGGALVLTIWMWVSIVRKRWLRDTADH